MLLTYLFTYVLSVLLCTKPVSSTASLRITADNHSFGGVNYPLLQFFTPAHRDDSIREIVKSGARVVRLFSMSEIKQICTGSRMIADKTTVRPDEQHADVRIYSL
jgi:hypothetical protein